MSQWSNLGAAVFAGEPDRLALVDLGGVTRPRRFSFADIDRHADAVAHALRERALPPGERVAILSANRAEYLFAFLGTMRAGLVSVPVNTKLPAATVRVVLEDSDARLVVADPAHPCAAAGGIALARHRAGTPRRAVHPRRAAAV